MNHESYIIRCLELAKKGMGHVAPNPMVGCVIVKNDRIIGEGYHQKYGEAHAEVNAINSVLNPSDLKGSSVYVSLEPCAHQGKTPPCSDLLIHHQVSEVIVCNRDPYFEVNGAGFEKIKKAGISVISGMSEKQGLHVNRRFFTFHEKKRPYVILKWAETLDGFIAPIKKTNDSVFWISGEASQQLVHQWRSEECAILVGKNTVISDNPRLNVRHVKGANPTRVILDSNLEIESTFNCYNSEAPTIVFNKLKNVTKSNIEFLKSDMTNDDVLRKLHQKNLLSVIIEGGLNVLTSFIQSNLWDEIRQFKNKKTLGNGIEAPIINQSPAKTTIIENDTLNIYLND